MRKGPEVFTTRYATQLRDASGAPGDKLSLLHMLASTT